MAPIHQSAESDLGSAELIVAYRSFRENILRVLQELHPNLRCKKDNYPANTDHNASLRGSLRTIRVEERRKLDHALFLSNQYANRGPLESVLLAELVLEETQVGGRDIVRMPDEQSKGRWLCRNLGHEGRFGDLRRFAFSHRQRVGRENFLEKFVQGSGRDPF